MSAPPKTVLHATEEEAEAIRQAVRTVDVSALGPGRERADLHHVPGLVALLSDERVSGPIYDLPRHRLIHHMLPEVPLRTSSLRGLGAWANVFAIESFIDELAEAAGEDPVTYRLSLLSDPRARRVVESWAPGLNWLITFGKCFVSHVRRRLGLWSGSERSGMGCARNALTAR